jgi:hypothetical protein
MNVIELFCGTKSFSKVAIAHGHINRYTIDSDPLFEPTFCQDILSFVPIYNDENILLWASPPCEFFSVASIGHHWNVNHTPKTDGAMLGLALLDKTIELISQIKPKYWFIENPRGKMRKVIEPFFKRYGVEPRIRHTVTYCQYGDTRMKPTDIWTNCMVWHPKPMCKNGAKCHERAPRGANTGTQGIKGARDRAIVPPALCEEILRAIDGLTNSSTANIASADTAASNSNNKEE